MKALDFSQFKPYFNQLQCLIEFLRGLWAFE